jgi:hypothetical protein
MLHASTIIARSSTQLIAHLSKLAASHNGQTLLFALSANAPDLSDLVSALTTYTSTSVGCLSAPLPAYADSGKYSCSIALFDSETTIPFRSTLAGRPPAQVGRWHAFRKGEDIPDKSVDMGLRSQVDWEDVWSRSTGERELPKGLEGLECVQRIVDCYVYLTHGVDLIVSIQYYISLMVHLRGFLIRCSILKMPPR